MILKFNLKIDLRMILKVFKLQKLIKNGKIKQL